MPMPITVPKIYNFKDVIVTIGTIPVSEYDPEGSLSFERQSEEVESALTADGLVHYSDNNDRRVRCTMTLMAKSASHQALLALAQAQRAARRAGTGVLPAIPFSMTSPTTGESVVSPYVVFISIPTPTQSKQEPTREWVMELPYGEVGEVYLPTEPPVGII